MKTTIKISFAPNGASSIEVNGVKGKSCYDLTKFLESDFEPSKYKRKAEFYSSQDETSKLRIEQN